MGSVMHGQSFGSVFVPLKHYEKRSLMGAEGYREDESRDNRSYSMRLLALMCHEFKKASGHYIMNDVILKLCFSQYTVSRVYTV